MNIADAVSNYKEDSRKNIRRIYVYIPLIGKDKHFMLSDLGNLMVQKSYEEQFDV